jgi:hypothetical protein
MKTNPGLEVEKKFSKSFHSEGIAVLVSPKILRQRQLGQLDLVRLKKNPSGWLLEVGEVKSSAMGVENMLRAQRSRIFSAQNFLAGIFGAHTRLIKLFLEEEKK